MASAFYKNYEHDEQEMLTFIRIGNDFKLIEVVQRK